MSETKMIHVFTRPPGPVRHFASGVILWGFPITAEGLSRWLFGGSWVIDIMVLVALLGLVARMGVRAAGTSVDMSRDEIRRWVSVGMPRDVLSWRRSEEAKVIRGGVIE